mgnify:CR=1 FL=1
MKKWLNKIYRPKNKYREICYLDEAREVRVKAEKKYFKDFRYKLIEVD